MRRRYDSGDMKKIELAFTALLVPIDFIVVFCATVAAYSLRYTYFADFRPFTLTIPIEDFFGLAMAWSAVFVLCFAMAGLYAIRGARRLKYELSRVFLASSTAAMVAIALIFFRGELFASRFIVLAAWIFSMVAVAIAHVVVRGLQRGLLRHGIGTRHVVLIGGKDDTTKLLQEEFVGNPGYGFAVAATFSSFGQSVRAKLDGLKEAHALDEIIVSNPEMERVALGDVLSYAQSRQLGFSYAADLVATYGRNIDIGAYAGIPLVTVKGTRLEGWGRIYKRMFDIVGSLVLIVVTLPIMVLVALAIKLDSRGPVFYSRKNDVGARTQRIGQDGKPFMYFKFRSMKVGMDYMRYRELAHLDEGRGTPIVKIKNDPRVTRVGSFLRKYSLDELPEFFLVLAGKMSLVGPRPHVPEEVAKYDDRHRRVLTVKPGITGMGQISGRRDLSFEEEVRLDTYYLENWSLWLDLAILMKTVGVVLGRKGAY